MSLAAMVLADRGERLIRFYDRWVDLITFGRARRARDAVLAEVAGADRLVDLGCGTGTLAIAAARAGADVVAVDRSPAMLRRAREQADAAAVRVDWRQGDLAFPPIEDERFDAATATFALSELSRDVAVTALRRMAEAVRPGGWVVIADEAPPSGFALRALAAIPRALLAGVSFFALQELAPTHRHPWRALLSEAGLEVMHERSYEAGGLVVLVAERPPELAARSRPVVDLEAALPTGSRGRLLRAGAWMDLPIAVTAGVYRAGTPDAGSPVLLTGNFLASVDAVHAGLAGRNAWVIVEDTDGWNVWCAGDAGLFTAEKAASLIELHRLEELVDARHVVVPRLGGRVRSKLAALTGWDVSVGPLEARDLPTYLEHGLTPEMHSLARLYRLPERVRVGALTELQLPLFLLPLRLAPASARGPAWRFALVAGVVLPLTHDRVPGRTGIAKATALGVPAALLGLVARRWGPGATLAILACAPLVGWVYQSSTPVIFWKRIWR